MKINDYQNELNKCVQFAEEIINEYLPAEEGKQKLIAESMNYSVSAGGKRLRPIFMYLTYKMFGGKNEVIKPFMAAIEMIHTYSLVHDDLPAMDNDMYRRGKLTTHAKYGEDIAVLAGDGLLNYSFETMSKAALNAENMGNAVKAMNLMVTKAGIYGMIGGQTVDVLNEDNKDIDLETILFIHNLKTAALIEASMMTGAILAGADDESLKKVEKIANNIGIAFQIQDDILDVIGDEEVLGKPVLSDEKNGKITYVTINGIEASKEKVSEYSNEAVSLLEEVNNNNKKEDIEFLKELIIKLIVREK